MPFQKATKRQSKLRLALIGPSGSGKTFSALRIGTALSDKVALVDTERGSASKYAGEFRSFDVLELVSFHPQRYIEAIHEAEAAGYEVLIIDSLSHAWMGKDGALELVDRAAKRDKGGNKFSAWGDITPLQNQLVDAIIGAKLHVIVTIRAKTEYVQEVVNGKTTIRKVGLQPVQRDGLEYEFDLVGDMDQSNTLIVSKSRCPALTGAVIDKPGPEVAATLKAWLTDGAPAADPPQPQPAAQPVAVNGRSAAPPPANAIERAFPAEQPAEQPTVEADFEVEYLYDGDTYMVPGKVATLSVAEVGAYLGYRGAIRKSKTLDELVKAFQVVNQAHLNGTIHLDAEAALIVEKDAKKKELSGPAF